MVNIDLNELDFNEVGMWPWMAKICLIAIAAVALLGAGYYFGNLPIIKDNFSIVIYGVIVISLAPPILIYFYRKAFVSS